MINKNGIKIDKPKKQNDINYCRFRAEEIVVLKDNEVIHKRGLKTYLTNNGWMQIEVK